MLSNKITLDPGLKIQTIEVTEPPVNHAEVSYHVASIPSFYAAQRCLEVPVNGGRSTT